MGRQRLQQQEQGIVAVAKMVCVRVACGVRRAAPPLYRSEPLVVVVPAE